MEMKFTFDEWKKIRHALEVAKMSFEEQAKDSQPSEEYLSMFQIFTRQVREMEAFMKRIDESVL
jgi:hypothetical protein